MSRDYYTTTEAANKLSVSADTVLKWVRAGKIESYRTPGGHARIPKESIQKLLPSDAETINRSPKAKKGFVFCWEYLSEKEDCQNCAAFMSRASRCYELLKIPHQKELLNLNCDSNCNECEYYKLTQNNELYVLLISANRDLIDSLETEAKVGAIVLKTVSTEYECAAAIDKFRPDYVIVDAALGISVTKELRQYLNNDKRFPLTRILICSRTAAENGYCDDDLFGWIKKPFTLEQLAKLIENAAKA